MDICRCVDVDVKFTVLWPLLSTWLAKWIEQQQRLMRQSEKYM